MNSPLNSLIVQETEYRLIECGIHRILTCIKNLTDDQLLYRPNSNSNSINNQILHLNGNVRQWLIATMTGIVDNRKRDEEFDSSNLKTKTELIVILENLEKDIRRSLPYIMHIDLSEKRHVQCYHETVISIIIHVIEHFSYHLGQITYITKMLLDIDTGYYAEMDLNKNN